MTILGICDALRRQNQCKYERGGGMICVICVCGTDDYNPSHDQHGVPMLTVFKDVNLDKPVIGSYRNSEPKFRQALVHYFTNKTNALY